MLADALSKDVRCEKTEPEESFTVLVAGHHGSAYATSEKLLDLVAPDLTIEILTDPDEFAGKLTGFKPALTEDEIERTEILAGILLALSM